MNTKINFQKVGIITKAKISAKIGIVKKLKRYLESRGAEVFLDTNCAFDVDGSEGYKKTQLLELVDLVITLGGDGTLLKTASKMPLKKVFVLPVNMGTLGFLTESTPENLFKHLDRVFKKHFVVDERMLLRTTIYRNNEKIESFLSLNECAITQGSFARLITLGVEVNQRKIVDLKADGLVVASPTGSTGHSLSAGGPIVHPNIDGFLLTPVCPVSLSNRPILIPSDRQIKITILSENMDQSSRVGLTLDGQTTFSLLSGDEVKIRSSSRKLRILRMTGQNYYKMLRTKLGWGN